MLPVYYASTINIGVLVGQLFILLSQYERPAACVIAQQYSSAKLVSMYFNSHKEKFGARLKKKFHCLSVLWKNVRRSVQSQWGFGGGDRKPVYPRSTSANVESRTDVI